MESSKDEYLPREIKLLVIHCSATRCNVSFPVERLRECHLQRGFRDIGYHFYITRDGVLHHCRPVSEIGAHVRGFNRHSIGICYEGGLDENGRPADTRTTAQRFALLDLLTILKHQYPEAQIAGTLSAECYDPQGMSLLRSEKGIFRIIKKLREMAKVLPPVVFC